MILVTGGAGLLGTELIKQLLAQNRAVTAIYHKTPLPDFNHAALRQLSCDILDVIALEEIMHGVEEIYHCAALVSFSKNDASRLFKINVEGTANLVNAALNAGVKKMMHVSSVSALGRIRENGDINENMQWSETTSNSRYGKTKYLGEMEVWRGIAEGLNAVIVNPTIILGPGNWNDGSTKIFKTVYGEFPWYSDGTSGFVDVRDVCKAMIMLMDKEIFAERFIISAENSSYENVFKMIAKAFNKKPASKKVTPFLAAIVWRLQALQNKFTGTIPVVTKETTAAALAKVQYDNSKLKKYLPSFSYRDLATTITDTCEALQQKLNMQ